MGASGDIELRHEQIPNAIFGAMLGVGIAANNDLAEKPANILAAFLEIGLFILIVLILTMCSRTGGLLLAGRRWFAGLLFCLAPIGVSAAFCFVQRAYLNYGDVMVMSVLFLWWASYLWIGLTEAFRRPPHAPSSENG